MDWGRLSRQLEIDSLDSFDLSNVTGGFSVENLVARRNGDFSGQDVRELIKVYSVIEYLTHRICFEIIQIFTF